MGPRTRTFQGAAANSGGLRPELCFLPKDFWNNIKISKTFGGSWIIA